MKKTRTKWCIRLVIMALLLANTTTAHTAPPAEKPGEPLSPEAEMAIMRVMNLENRIQTLQTVPVRANPDVELSQHFTGTWLCFTTMRLNGQLGRGIMQINLKQEGDELTGDGGQLKHPFDPPSTIRPIGTWASLTPFIGPIQEGSRRSTQHGGDRETGSWQGHVGDLYCSHGW